MASLATITYQMRTVGKFAGLVLSVILIIFLGYKVFLIMQPPKKIPISMCFGKLDQVPFPEQPTVNTTYKINTTTGALPVFPDRVQVYKIPTPKPQLSALEDARQLVKKPGLNFISNEQKVTSDIYSWQDSNNNTIQYNIISHQFEVFPNPNFDIASDATISETPSAIESAADQYLQSLGVDTSNLQAADDDLQYYQNSGAALIPADSPGQATVVRINYSYTPIPITTPVTNSTGKALQALSVVFPLTNFQEKSILQVTMYQSSYSLEPFSAKFPYQPVNTSTSCDYPLITAQQALDQLQKGNAYYIIGGTVPSEVDLNDVSLAYYIGKEKQDYTLPVVVFKGKDFEAYVPALAANSYK